MRMTFRWKDNRIRGEKATLEKIDDVHLIMEQGDKLELKLPDGKLVDIDCSGEMLEVDGGS